MFTGHNKMIGITGLLGLFSLIETALLTVIFLFIQKKDPSVTRRFSDFLGLRDKLSEKYLQNGRIIPPAPDKSIVGQLIQKCTTKNNPIPPSLISIFIFHLFFKNGKWRVLNAHKCILRESTAVFSILIMIQFFLYQFVAGCRCS